MSRNLVGEAGPISARKPFLVKGRGTSPMSKSGELLFGGEGEVPGESGGVPDAGGV